MLTKTQIGELTDEQLDKELAVFGLAVVSVTVQATSRGSIVTVAIEKNVPDGPLLILGSAPNLCEAVSAALQRAWALKLGLLRVTHTLN